MGVSDFTQRLVRYDLNLTLWCLSFYDLAPFIVFDSFSHLFLPCFVNKKLPPFDQILRKVVPENVKCESNKNF